VSERFEHTRFPDDFGGKARRTTTI
jgi:hypothetical protein